MLSSGPAVDGWCCVHSQDPVPDPLFVPMAGALAFGLQSLDCVDVHVFEVKAMVMRSIPKFMNGMFRGAMKVGLHEITKGRAANNIQVESRGRKLCMLLRRLLLSKPSRKGLIRLKERVTKFCAGVWIPLLEASMEDALVGRSAQAKRRRCQKDTVEHKAARTLGLAQLGELPSARQVQRLHLVMRRWKELSDETKRPRRQ